MNERATLPQFTIEHIERMIAEGRSASLPTDIIDTYTRQTGKIVPPPAGSTPADEVVSFAAGFSTPSKASHPVRRRAPRIALQMANSSQPRGFLKLMRTSTTEALLSDKNALHLLTVIGYRARWSNEPGLNDLTFGQALIGDFGAIGLTRAEYRAAMMRLTKWRLATFSSSNRGTVATLLDSRVFSLADERISSNCDQPASHHSDQQLSLGDSLSAANETTSEVARERPASNQLATTNQKVRRKEGLESNTDSAPTSPASISPGTPKRQKPALSDESWLAELAADPAFAGLNIPLEHAKMVRWASTNGKPASRKRMVNWLNRADRPMVATAGHIQGANRHQLLAPTAEDHAKGFFHGTGIDSNP